MKNLPKALRITKAARRHATKGNGFLEHGTRSGHNNYGCHCPLCVAADRAYKRDRYARLTGRVKKTENEEFIAAHPEVPVIEVFPEPAD